MQDKINQFFLKYNETFFNFEGQTGYQCMSVFEQYNKDIVGGQPVYGNAIDVINKYDKNLYDFIANTPDNSPSYGDVVLWTSGIGQFGHISVCLTGDSNRFISFDQNFPIGSKCHFETHNYNDIAGWLRPKSVTTPPEMLQINDQSKYDFGSPYGILEMQAVRSQLQAKDHDIEITKGKLDLANTLVADLQKELTSVKQQLQDCKQQPTLSTNVPLWIRRIFHDKV